MNHGVTIIIEKQMLSNHQTSKLQLKTIKTHFKHILISPFFAYFRQKLQSANIDFLSHVPPHLAFLFRLDAGL